MAPTPTPPTPERRRFIDLSLPLHWLIGCFFLMASGMISLGMLIANQTNKINQVVDSNVQIVAAQKESGGRLDTMREQLNEVKQAQALLAMRVGTVERDINK